MIVLDKPSGKRCECASLSCSKTDHGFICGAKPARIFMLSGWPDAIPLCDECSAELRRRPDVAPEHRPISVGALR